MAAEVPGGVRTTVVSGLCDTGAQMCIMDMHFVARMGLWTEDFLECKMHVSTAKNAVMTILELPFLPSRERGGIQSQHMV